ncbi:Uncharacterised protein [Phocoenobacter uteri]|uniref:Uncharacterized protein n=1 Tax=Phocoenobacter uteri TaxID=146806 RepID=A0A379CB80_9PAST|nr:hypothetical protein [Phocoenobacter uteri]MDG6880942.1 hypothetical protein [Phocoenobacter uteri]MDG6882787.1 hypothetical protein [Phocoenobacter uteri]SUB58956.1 Uncharacterised protein [Phocoenobacter uteri]
MKDILESFVWLIKIYVIIVSVPFILLCMLGVLASDKVWEWEGWGYILVWLGIFVVFAIYEVCKAYIEYKQEEAKKEALKKEEKKGKKTKYIIIK